METSVEVGCRLPWPYACLMSPEELLAFAILRDLGCLLRRLLERMFAREQLSVRPDEILGGECLFGGDAFETQVGTQTFGSCVSVGDGRPRHGSGFALQQSH